MNHTVAHMAGAGFLLLLAAGCNRPAPGLNDSETAMNGYRIEGKLIDEFLRPLVGVQVLLYYDLSFISADSTSRAYTPSSQGEVVTIEVKDRAGQTVRTLFSGPAPQDSLVVVSWNERDDNGDIVRSGLYTVTYTVAGVVRKSYRLIIDGNQNSVTDTEGRFVSPNQTFRWTRSLRIMIPVTRLSGSFRSGTKCSCGLSLPPSLARSVWPWSRIKLQILSSC